MGRGRAKAKQTKVARQLKYQTIETDFDALERELGSPDRSFDGDQADENYDDDDAEDTRWTG